MAFSNLFETIISNCIDHQGFTHILSIEHQMLSKEPKIGSRLVEVWGELIRKVAAKYASQKQGEAWNLLHAKRHTCKKANVQ
jgi:hypothetical protein